MTLELNRIPRSFIETVYRGIEQAHAKDYPEYEQSANLVTHNAKSFQQWDYLNRNLKQALDDDNVVFFSQKQGMWEFILIYEKESNMLISLMRETRFKTLQKSWKRQKVQYIETLLQLNYDFQAPNKPLDLFPCDKNPILNEKAAVLLDSICATLKKANIEQIHNHVLVVFDTAFGQLGTLNAYILDSDFEAVERFNWLNFCKPSLDLPEQVSEEEHNQIKPKLTEKAQKRIKEKSLVALRSLENSVIATDQ